MKTARRADIRELIRGHRPSDPLEERHLVSLEALLEIADHDPFDRVSFVPGHITASAFVVSPDRLELLMIYHGKLHRWLQPGGHVEVDDPTVEAAAIREVREETGLVLTGPGTLFDIDVHSIPARKGDPAHRHYDIRYSFEAPVAGAVMAGDDAVDVRWVRLADVPELASDASVLRPLRKILGQGQRRR